MQFDFPACPTGGRAGKIPPMDYYPPNPLGVPAPLPPATSIMKWRAAYLMLVLGLFFTLYFSLIFYAAALIGWATWAALNTPWDSVPWITVKAVSLLASLPMAILAIGMVKNLCKSLRLPRQEAIEIFPHEHPRFFAFLARVCKDVGVPMPRRVFVDHRVNAAALPDRTSLLDFVLSTRKNLRLGLGLVNSVNLTEFKAILAHEIGHFTQKTTWLALYVQVAALVCALSVHGDDRFDRFLRAWANLPRVLAWPAHVVLGGQTGVHLLLGANWRLIYFCRQALRRQEELHADLIAVRLTGSDAPVQAFARCDVGQSCWHDAMRELKAARKSGLFSADLFFHQRTAIDRIDDRCQPACLDRREISASEIWDDHPSDQEREANAKAIVVPTEFDPRSPWLLFDQIEGLRQRVTCEYYCTCGEIHDEVSLTAPEIVQCFMDDHRAATVGADPAVGDGSR